MEYHWPCVRQYRIHERRERQLYGVICIYRQSDDLPREEIDDGGDIYDLSLKWEVGEVGYPDMVFIQRTCRHEEVRVYDLDIPGLFPLPAAPAICLDAEEIHHPLHRLPIHFEMQCDAT